MLKCVPLLLLGAFLWTPAAAGNSVNAVRRLEEQVARLEKQVAAMQARLAQLEMGRSAAEVRVAVERPAAQHTEPAPAPPTAPAKLPPLSFQGEFRLYFDSLTRPSGGGAPRLSNIRGRYLLHLDFKAPVHPTLSIHGRLSTGPLNNPLTDIQDFGGGVAKHPFFLAEAYADFHPNPSITLQGGRLDSPFNDRARFLFDTDTRFNGTNEIFRRRLQTKPWGIRQIQFIAGQYTFTNPNFPVVQPDSPSTAAGATPSQAFVAAGAQPGKQPRASQLFQQGMILDQTLREDLTQQVTLDVQLYRNPNQLRLLSTPGGLFLAGTTIGIVPSGPFPSPGNATTTPNGATLAVPGFRIGHVSYTLAHSGAHLFGRQIPLSLNAQFARNLAPVASDRNAMAAILSAGRSAARGDLRLLYAFYRKQANSLISEVTENDIALGSNVNMTAHLVRTELVLGRGVVWANNFIFSSFLRNSDPSAGFFVPLGRNVPGQFRYQGMLIFRF